MKAVYNTPREAFTVALFLTNSLEFAKFLHRQNQSVQVNAFYVYVCPTHPYLPKQVGVEGRYKFMNLFEFLRLFHRRKNKFRS